MRVEERMDGVYLNTVARKLKWKMTTGDDFLWDCYPEARIMDFEDNNKTFHVSVIFNSESLLVYEITGHGPLFSLTSDDIWRWINSEYETAFLEACKARKIDPKRAYDDVDYEELTTEKELIRRLEMVEGS